MSSLAPSTESDALTLLRRHGERLHGYFVQIRARHDQAPARLVEAIQYSLLAGGKRLRPTLVLECCDACLGSRRDASPKATKSALAAAAAMEFIHTFSLVHDDLPAMDDDALRRGRPTCHIVYGEAMAILAGDALQALAFEILATPHGEQDDPLARIAMLRALGAACGAEGMAGGQAFDLSAVGQKLSLVDLERMHSYKTGALIRASVRLGALAAGCTDPDLLGRLDRYGHAVGLAFQVRDDILDVEGESAVIGKTAGKDAAADKPTFPSIIGLPASRERLDALVRDALDAIAPLGARGEYLADLARYSAQRAH